MKTKKNYVVGYVGDKQAIYGPNNEKNCATYIDRMTYRQAQKKLKTLVSFFPKTIYKLVSVKSKT